MKSIITLIVLCAITSIPMYYMNRTNKICDSVIEKLEILQHEKDSISLEFIDSKVKCNRYDSLVNQLRVADSNLIINHKKI